MIATIESALKRYELGEVAEIAPAPGEHENAPHRVTTESGICIVKVLAPRLSGRPACEVRHAFVDRLAEAGVPAAALVRTPGGEGCVREGPRAVEVYRWIDSEASATAEAAWSLLREVHEATDDLAPRTPGSRRDWLTPEGDLTKLEVVERQMQTYVPAPEMFEPLNRVKQALIESSGALRRAELPTRMVHGSVDPGSFIAAPEGAHMVDFDWCHMAPRVMDVAMGIVTFGMEFVDEGYGGFETDLLPAAVTRVTIHLGLEAGKSPEAIAEELERLPVG